MALSAKPRSVYKSKWNKYEEGVKEAATDVVVQAFHWLYEYERLKSKDPGDTTPIPYVGEYLKTLRGGMKGFTKDQRDQLNNEEPPQDMDITSLYRFLQRTCGLAAESDPVWYDDNDSLEHSLYLVKKERNDVSHESRKPNSTEMTDSELKGKLDNLRKLCSSIIYKAGQRACRPCKEITDQIDTMSQTLTDILGVDSERFAQLAREEKEKLKQKGDMCEEKYVTPLISNKGVPLPLRDLFHCPSDDDSASELILVNGDAGAGKTTLCSYLDWMWVTKKQEEICTFDLVLVIFFNDLDTSDLIKKLREDLLPDTSSWCDPYTIDDLLSQLRVLWILDGIEDATRDAEVLMRRMVQQQHDNHTILITSRSAYVHTLFTKFPDKTILDITLDGANPMEMLEKFIRSENSTNYNPEDVNKLKQKFQNLPVVIKNELQNPLKMHMTLEDFRSENFNPDKIFDLTGLYQRHKERQIKSLVIKHTIGKISESEALRRIEKWFLLLCNVAYDKVCGRLAFTIYIDSFPNKKLEDECDNLGLHSSECLSTFLTHTHKCSPKESTGYAFYHGTQQYFLAALHIASKIKDSSDVKSDLFRFFGISSEQNNEDSESIHLYQVLVQLTVLLGADIDEKTTEALVIVLDYVIPKNNFCQNLLNIIHAVSSSNQRILKYIDKVTCDSWFVNNSQIEDAMNLLQFCRPRTITLQFRRVTRLQFSSALDFLRELTNLPVLLKLSLVLPISNTLDTQDTLDPYLEVICQENSQCIILGLSGHITPDNYGLLKRSMISDYCESMNFIINSPASLHQLYDALDTLESTKMLRLTLINRLNCVKFLPIYDRKYHDWLRKELSSHFIIPHKGKSQQGSMKGKRSRRK